MFDINAPNQCGLVAIYDWNYNVEVIGAERSRGQVYSYYTYQLLTSATAHANELNPCFTMEVGMNFSAVVISASFLSLWNEKLPLLRLTWPLLVPVVSFAAFVVTNGAIVVGDEYY